MIGQTISHFHILEKLGEGGMGIVYKAGDTKLGRDVAVEFLPPELTRDEEAKRRFIQEAQAASALQHNNICTIHDIDETPDNQLYIVMDCYDGESLKSRIAKSEVRIEEAVDLAIQLAQGLQKAHGKGIVHRDIKPGNIIITNDGVVKILDFGLAKLAGQAGVTKTGSTVGTAAYMSPEQARGVDVDHRTDIWSLGVVLFELLTGKLPFRGEHEAALLYSIVHEEPQAISSLRANVPRAVVSVINKALQKDRTQRFQTARDLMSELKSATTLAVDLPKQEKSIVVLPFENLSPDPDNAFFADGLTEELIAALSKVRTLRVISRTTAMLLRDSRKNVPTIARELNVRYVLEGSVRRAGNGLRITAQLIDAPADVHLWADAYSGTLEDVFGIQERVARAIAAALEVTLDPGTSAKLAERPIASVAAYDCYLRAIESMWELTEASLARSVEHLQRALGMEPNSALLHGALAYVWYQHANAGLEPLEGYRRRAREEAERAFALDPEAPLAHLAVGLLVAWENPLEGIRSFKRVLRNDPNHVEALIWLAAVTSHACSSEAAHAAAWKVRQLDPLHPMADWLEGCISMFGGDFERAMTMLRESVRKTNLPVSLWFLGLTLAYLGRIEEACPLLSEAFKGDEASVASRITQVLVHAFKGGRERAWAILRSDLDAREATRRDCTYALFVAECHALLGDLGGALEWIERSVSLGGINYPFLSRHDPFLAPLRGEERFKKLMVRVKKEWEEFEL